MKLSLLTAVAGFLFLPALAHADAEELTIRLEAIGVGMLSEDYGEHGSRSFTPAPGGGLHVGYGVSDTLELGIGASGSYASREAFSDLQLPSPHTNRGSLEQTELVLRATVGGEVHFGRRIIPVFRFFGGYQHRSLSGADYFDPQSGAALLFVPDRSDSDIVVGAGFAVDIRLGQHVSVSFGVHGVHAFPLNGRGFDSIEVPITLAFSFYPRWFSGSRFEPGGQPLVEE